MGTLICKTVTLLEYAALEVRSWYVGKLTLWCRNNFFLILAHPVYKM